MTDPVEVQAEGPSRDDQLPASATRQPPRLRVKRAGRVWIVPVAALEWVGLIAAAFVIAFVIKTFLFAAFYIPSESMVPTLKVKDRVLVDKVSYELHPVHRADIVVFTKPRSLASDVQIKDLVKRVIGLPGDSIEGRGGHILIDGRVLSEPYLPAGTQSRTFGPVTVPPDSYFVLGDNRQFSKDSTYFGPIRRSELVGRVFVRFWPVSRIAFIGPSYLIPLIVALAVVLLGVVLLAVVPRARRARAP